MSAARALKTAADAIRALGDVELLELALRAERGGLRLVTSPGTYVAVEPEEKTVAPRRSRVIEQCEEVATSSPRPIKPPVDATPGSLLAILAEHPEGLTTEELGEIARRSTKSAGLGLGSLKSSGRVAKNAAGKWVVA